MPMALHPFRVVCLLRGYSLPQLARAAGISPSLLYGWLRGRVGLSDGVRQRIAVTLDVPAAQVPRHWPRELVRPLAQAGRRP